MAPLPKEITIDGTTYPCRTDRVEVIDGVLTAFLSVDPPIRDIDLVIICGRSAEGRVEGRG